jgi:tetratricopeptide (TPR) repeat protein
MHRNPWFTLVIGLMVGLVLGYIFAERQSIPPAQSAPAAASASQQGLPDGHPPVPDGAAAGGGAEQQRLAQEAAQLQNLLAQSPDDPRLMIALGNLYFDAGRWQESRMWYERALSIEGGDPNVITDLAVVYRNLDQPERALELLVSAVEAQPGHWQAWYNRVIVLHFDLHRHDEAAAALAELKKIAESNPDVPDLASLEAEVLGGH